MPRQKILSQEINMDTQTQTHHIIRTISRNNISNHGADLWTAAEVDDYLAGWFVDGWKLFNAYFLGEIPEGYKTLYILIKG